MILGLHKQIKFEVSKTEAPLLDKDVGKLEIPHNVRHNSVFLPSVSVGGAQ